MNAKMSALVQIAKLNHKLFHSAMQELSPAALKTRPNHDTNSIAFIALHVIDARYYAMKVLGSSLENPFAERLKDVKKVSDLEVVPALDEMLSVWDSVSESFESFLTNMKDEDLEKAITHKFPVVEQTPLGAGAFMLEHESYHIGQISFLRKFLGFDAMKYRT